MKFKFPKTEEMKMTNEILTLIKTRRSIRAFKPDAVQQELLDAVL